MPNKKNIAKEIEGEIFEECPNCGSVWSPATAEYDSQKCDSCGYPDNEEDFGCDEDYEDDEDEWEG
jgi:hypothetical protein